MRFHMLTNLYYFEESILLRFNAIKNSLFNSRAVILLSFRVWIFYVFFFSGWLKVTSWETTKMLFEFEYAVPLLSPLIAAVLSTFVELMATSLLLLGVMPRISALMLFVLNFVAAISYPDISPAGEQQHLLWGTILAVLVIFGRGSFINQPR